MARVAVVLSGSGYLDGSEIREAVIALLALDRGGAEVQIFAPNVDQSDVVNHLTGEATSETRNVLVESARIARGQVKDLEEAKADDFDALVLPGGYGAAKNLSNLATAGAEAEAIPAFKRFVTEFIEQGKPIGAICISPAVLVAAIRDKVSPMVTIGDDADGLIAGLGGQHETCATENMTFDVANQIISCSAYMREDSLANVASGIEKVVDKVLALTA